MKKKKRIGEGEERGRKGQWQYKNGTGQPQEGKEVENVRKNDEMRDKGRVKR